MASQVLKELQEKDYILRKDRYYIIKTDYL